MSSASSMLRQETIFNDFWSRFSEQIASGQGTGDFLSTQDLRPKHVTTVIRLPQVITQKIASIGKEILSVDPNHYSYPPTDQHFTIINLDTFFPHGFEGEQETIFATIAHAMRALPPLKMEAKGFGIFPTTIFVQLYDTAGVLEQYRAAINSVMQKSLGLNVENKSVAEHVAFSNFIRFKGPPDRRIVGAVRELREMEFGSFIANEMQLVTTDKLLSTQNTFIHKVFPLNDH